MAPDQPSRSGSLGTAIGIVTHNSVSELETYFSGQVEVAEQLGLPLIVIDNASRDGSAEYIARVAADVPDFRLVRNDRNMGFAAAVNRAFAEAGQDDVLLLNADVEVSDPAAVIELLEALRASPRIGVLAPRLVNPDGSTQSSARAFPSVLGMAGHASAARWLPLARRAATRYLQLPSLAGPSPVDWAIGAALLVRREAFDAVGGFDDRFFLYLEDTDFCLRCAVAGWETWYEPRVVFQHFHVRASDPEKGGVLRSRARRHHIASLIRFFARYPGLAFDGRWRRNPITARSRSR